MLNRSFFAAISASEHERLLLIELAQTAFIVNKMDSFLSWVLEQLEQNDSPSCHLICWEEISANLINYEGNTISEQCDRAKLAMANDGDKTIFLLCNTTSSTFKDNFTNQPVLFSAPGLTIFYFRGTYRNLEAFQRVGLSTYTVTHHVTDMYHHRNFRGAYTETVTPSGTSKIEVRAAVGLDQEERNSGKSKENLDNKMNASFGH